VGFGENPCAIKRFETPLKKMGAPNRSWTPGIDKAVLDRKETKAFCAAALQNVEILN
jgi:hypothetical protein